MTKLSECYKCGVAFNVGVSTCQERDCKVTAAEVKKSKNKKYNYTKRPADPIYTRYTSVLYRAKKKQVPFDLTQELIQNILNQACVYCGDTAGIQLDRKVGEDGYTSDNVVPACKRCNTVKSMYLTHAEMMVVAKALGWCTDD